MEHKRAALILIQLNHGKTRWFCFNCLTHETPLRRKRALADQVHPLCNACGLHFRQGHFCPFCNYIYKIRRDIESQPADWILCQSCGKRCHRACAMSHMKGDRLPSCMGCATP